MFCPSYTLLLCLLSKRRLPPPLHEESSPFECCTVRRPQADPSLPHSPRLHLFLFPPHRHLKLACLLSPSSTPIIQGPETLVGDGPLPGETTQRHLHRRPEQGPRILFPTPLPLAPRGNSATRITSGRTETWQRQCPAFRFQWT